MAEAGDATTATARSSSPLHIVVFPWLAFGHIIPYMQLSEQLARRGHAVTFVSTPRNLARLRPVPEDLRPRIRLLPLPLPRVDGLRDGAESTADVPPEKGDLLKVAFDGLAAPFADFLAGACSGGGVGEGAIGFCKKPDWIFVDFAHHWLPPIAEQHKVPCALFSIFPASFIAFAGTKAANEARPRVTAEDLTAQPPWIPFPTPIAHRLYEAEQMVYVFRPKASGLCDAFRFWETERQCTLFILRSCREVDGALCPLIADLFGKPLALSGLLAPYDAARAAQEAGRENDDEKSASLMRWLDEQPARSVLYVAFGSEAPLTAENIRELAAGLELSGARFLWALREASAPLLPDDGFAERVAGRGVVRAGWVPQVRVLAHGAVGGFLTHAGWSSLMESFLFGHPLVMLPLFADQGLTARVMAARAVGLEVPRDERDGSFGRADLASTVRRVMAREDEEGKALARNAREFQEMLCDRAKQEEYVDELVEHLRRLA
ncbi:hypothetical protein ZWY2020_036712 [Hordeum vulgare]|nr:hypothetical protein ZWY2020_036712 [Hordeum vulgare]